MRVDTLESGPRMSQVFNCSGQFATFGARIVVHFTTDWPTIRTFWPTIPKLGWLRIVAKTHTWIVATIVASGNNPIANPSNNGNNYGRNNETAHDWDCETLRDMSHNPEAMMSHNFIPFGGFAGWNKKVCQKQHNFLELAKLKENVLLEYGLAVPGHFGDLGGYRLPKVGNRIEVKPKWVS